MRKDLKIGLAIGAVLLVVLIVYLAVPKNPSTDVAQSGDDTRNPVDLQTTGGGTGGDGAKVAQQPAETEKDTSSNAAATDKGTDVFSREDIKPGTGDKADDKSATASAESKGTNWDLLLATGQIPQKTVTPSLRASNTVAPVSETTGSTPAAAPAVKTDTDGTPVGTTGTDATSTTEVRSATDDAGKTTTAREPESTDTTTTASATGARTHKVKAGETFSSIAKTAYKDDRHFLAIEAANPGIDPKKLKPGMVINLPDVSATAETASAKVSADTSSETEKSTKPESTATKVDSKSEYKVKRGDSLYKIAVEVYGSSNMVDAIYQANKDAIGADSSKLKLGTVLKLPANPNAQASSR